MKLIKSSIDKIIVKHCIVIGLDSKKENKTVTCFQKMNMMISIQQYIAVMKLNYDVDVRTGTEGSVFPLIDF